MFRRKEWGPRRNQLLDLYDLAWLQARGETLTFAAVARVHPLKVAGRGLKNYSQVVQRIQDAAAKAGVDLEQRVGEIDGRTEQIQLVFADPVDAMERTAEILEEVSPAPLLPADDNDDAETSVLADLLTETLRGAVEFKPRATSHACWLLRKAATQRLRRAA